MRTILVALLVVTGAGCEKSKAPRSEVAPSVTPQKKEKGGDGKAEVEFVGTWSAGEVKAAKVIFVTQSEPCLPVPEKPTRFGEAKLDVGAPGPLFAEFYIPQGTKGHSCLYGLDEAGKVVGAADSTQNPMTFEGEGEVVKTKLAYVLKAP
jgi:hypothetical protein